MLTLLKALAGLADRPPAKLLKCLSDSEKLGPSVMELSSSASERSARGLDTHRQEGVTLRDDRRRCVLSSPTTMETQASAADVKFRPNGSNQMPLGS